MYFADMDATSELWEWVWPYGWGTIKYARFPHPVKKDDQWEWSSLKSTGHVILSRAADPGCMDVNTLAYKIVQQAIGHESSKKQPASANGGEAQATKRSSEEWGAIAVKAARGDGRGYKTISNPRM